MSRRAVFVACFAFIALAAAPGFAAADCVGYATETERIDFANEHAALIATATATEVERYERSETGGVPIDVYTFTVDTIHRGAVSGSTVRIAAPQDSSISRTFAIGERYFLATHDTSRDHGWSPTDVARVAPYVDDACTPTIALRETSPGFLEAVASTFPAGTGLGNTSGAPGNDDANSSTRAVIAIAATAAALLATGIALAARRRIRRQRT